MARSRLHFRVGAGDVGWLHQHDDDQQHESAHILVGAAAKPQDWICPAHRSQGCLFPDRHGYADRQAAGNGADQQGRDEGEAQGRGRGFESLFQCHFRKCGCGRSCAFIGWKAWPALLTKLRIPSRDASTVRQTYPETVPAPEFVAVLRTDRTSSKICVFGQNDGPRAAEPVSSSQRSHCCDAAHQRQRRPAAAKVLPLRAASPGSMPIRSSIVLIRRACRSTRSLNHPRIFVSFEFSAQVGTALPGTIPVSSQASSSEGSGCGSHDADRSLVLSGRVPAFPSTAGMMQSNAHFALRQRKLRDATDSRAISDRAISHPIGPSNCSSCLF